MTNSWQINTRRRLAATLALAFGGVAGSFASAQDAKLTAYGRHLARECTGCHRLDGIDNGIPSIVGLPPDVFIAAIGLYQTGARNNPVMVSVATSLSEKQVSALAGYFASLPKPASKARPKAGK